RAQGAWLLGLRGGENARRLIVRLLTDPSPFTRRRATEALAREVSTDPVVLDALCSRLDDPERLVRYLAMNALAHRPIATWFEQAAARPSPQAQVRALMASMLRREPPPAARARAMLAALLGRPVRAREDHLDVLRLLTVFQTMVEGDPVLRAQVQACLLRGFPDPDPD